MGITSKTVARGIAFGLLLTIAPAAAYAVSVSSDEGNGTQTRKTSYGNGADVQGTLRSTLGGSVYYSGKVVISNCGNTEVGRYSKNTSSSTYVNRGGVISAIIGGWPCSFDGVESRICKDVLFIDPCGAWSVKY